MVRKIGGHDIFLLQYNFCIHKIEKPTCKNYELRKCINYVLQLKYRMLILDMLIYQFLCIVYTTFLSTVIIYMINTHLYMLYINEYLIESWCWENKDV